MGFESASFQYLPAKAPSSGWGPFLVKHGAESRPVSIGFPEFVLKGDDYWIDFQLQRPRTGTPETQISIQIALCNPDQAFDRLVGFLPTLLEKGGGILIDRHTRSRFRVWESSTAVDVRASLEEQQAEFEKYFGDHKVAVPGEVAIEAVREGWVAWRGV